MSSFGVTKMDDLLQMALRRRDRFKREVDRLDAFIALGEHIVKMEEPRAVERRPAAPEDTPTHRPPTGVTSPRIVY